MLKNNLIYNVLTMENTQQSERDVRIQKIQKMKELWVKPYAQHFNKKDLVEDIIKQYSEKEFRDINDIIPNPEKQVPPPISKRQIFK